MRVTLHINDISNPEVQAFLDYAKSLKFVSIDEEEISLSPEQIEAIEGARISLKKNGGKSHQEVLFAMKNKYPNAFNK